MISQLRVNVTGALAATLLLLAAPPDAPAVEAAMRGPDAPVVHAAMRGADAPIVDAAMRGQVDEVKALIEGGEDVNAARGDGMTALHWAAYNGDPAMADLLLEAGAAVEPRTRLNDYTPLHLAAKGAHADVVLALLEAGADARALTSTGTAALHFAAGSGDADGIRALLAHSASVDVREDAWNQTPLMFASSYGRLEAVRALLEAGADPALTSGVVDIAERAAVDGLAEDKREEVLAAFREADGGDPNWRPSPAQAQAAAMAVRDVQMNAEPPVDEEGEGRGGGTKGGLTALLHAVREGWTDVALALLEGGADIDQVSAGDHTSPLLMATINGRFDLAVTLLERGADPNLASDAGATPLFTTINTKWAPRSRYPQQQAYMLQETTYLGLMKKLLEAGADVNARLSENLWYISYTFDLLDVNMAGATTFWRAAYATDVEAMRLLVAYGADPALATIKPEPRRRFRRGGESQEEGPDPSGLPPVPPGGPGVYPIHAASGVGYGEGYAGNAHRHVPQGWLPSVRYLVEEMGADVNARDMNGYTALHHAAARGDNPLILYLVSKGADVSVVSREGETTADMANGPVQRISPFPSTIALLERLGSKNNHNCRSC